MWTRFVAQAFHLVCYPRAQPQNPSSARSQDGIGRKERAVKGSKVNWIMSRRYYLQGEMLTDFSAVIPALVVAAANSYVLWNEHWEHWSHMEPLEERTEYSYQNIRSKNFFWGDGDKTILYVTPHTPPCFSLWHSRVETVELKVLRTCANDSQLELFRQPPQGRRVNYAQHAMISFCERSVDRGEEVGLDGSSRLVNLYIFLQSRSIEQESSTSRKTF